MTPTTGYATKDELYQVKQDLSNRIGAVELSLKQDIARVHERVDQVQANINVLREDMDERLARMEQNNMALFAALFAHLGIDTPPLQ